MAPSAPVVPLTVVKISLGGLEVSVHISTFLYAITCSQIFVYWRSNFQDKHLIRMLVWDFTSRTIFANAPAFQVIVVWCISYHPDVLYKSLSDNTLRLLETIHTVIYWIYLYELTITQYGDLSTSYARHWSYDIGIIFNGLICLCIEVSVLSDYVFYYLFLIFANESSPTTPIGFILYQENSSLVS